MIDPTSCPRRVRAVALPGIGAAASLFLLLLAVAPPASAQNLNIRPGQWEARTAVAGNAVAAAPLGGTDTEVTQSCITAEQIAEGRFGIDDDDDEGCRRTFSTRTTTRWEGRYTCESGGGSFRIDAPAPDRLTMTMVIEHAGESMRVNAEARWVKAQCDPDLD